MSGASIDRYLKAAEATDQIRGVKRLWALVNDRLNYLIKAS